MLGCSYSTRLQRNLILQLQITLTQWWVCFTPCFNAQPDIFAVINFSVVTLSLFSSDILTWSADNFIFSVMTHKLREVRAEEYAYYVNNFAQTFVKKHESDVKLWRHKQCTWNTNDRHMPLNETALMKIFCILHWISPYSCHEYFTGTLLWKTQTS